MAGALSTVFLTCNKFGVGSWVLLSLRNVYFIVNSQHLFRINFFINTQRGTVDKWRCKKVVLTALQSRPLAKILKLHCEDL